MKISAHFTVQEFLPPEIVTQFGEAAKQFIDPRIVNLAEFYRSYFGKPIIINNWNIGGQFHERGFRNPVTGTGGRLSQHKFGRAVDCNIDGMTPQEHYTAILANPKLFIEKGLTTLENIQFTNGWVHSDCRDNSGFGSDSVSYKWQDGILIVNP